MTDQTKTNVTSWVIGLFTGVGIAAPITAYVVKKIYSKKSREAAVEAYKRGTTNTILAMKSLDDAFSNERYSNEEDYAEHSDEGIPSAEEIENYDVSIDDEEATRASEISVEDQERYKDMVQRYNGDLAIVPYMIDAEKFGLDQTHEKSFINWYEDDNVFEEDLLRIQSPYDSFGVSDGNELFKYDERRPDPNTVYIRNDKQNVDYEITKVHGSYSKTVLGIKPNDETDSDE